jgi:predicted RNA-binding protein with TRAM domain
MNEKSFNGRGFRGAGNLPPKPVEVGKEYDVEIQEISRRGEGIARIEGLVVFVPNTQNGDHVKIRVTRISRRFAEAEVLGKEEDKTVDKEETEEIEEKLPEQKVEEKPEEKAEIVDKEEDEEKKENED